MEAASTRGRSVRRARTRQRPGGRLGQGQAGLGHQLLSPGQVALLIAHVTLMFGVCLLACVVPTRRALGVEPTEERIVAVKSSVHFRADFGPIAEQVLVVAAPGPVVADPATLPFRNLRRGLRLRPGTNQAFAPGERSSSGGD